LATFCGKALVKVSGQVVFFVFLFNHTNVSPLFSVYS
jgi:hypothetical protein